MIKRHVDEMTAKEGDGARDGMVIGADLQVWTKCWVVEIG